MIRPILAAIAAVALATPLLAAPPIAGRWLTADGGAVVAIGDCGGALCGRIAKVIKGPPTGPWVDARNPDPKLKNRPLVGLAILTGMTASGDGWKGSIYDPKTGKTYRAVVARDGANLKVQGCIAIFCQTMTWTRAG
ncbi:MAG: DUF2147 domain-containing protein [Sphingomonas sp.]|uniref:DUF2147 domain-containing protein n=1 Tax=Sphingomonas sp. TaxID=28214 RepID=UPI003F813BB8